MKNGMEEDVHFRGTSHKEKTSEQGSHAAAGRRVPNYAGQMLKYEDTLCGVGRFKPRVMQVFTRIGWFTAFNSFAYLMMSALLSYVNSQLTTLERQFGLSAKQMALILVSNDISYIFCVLFASYFGNKVHIPRTIALGVFTMGAAGIICTLPHFIYGARLQDDGTSGNATLRNASEELLLHGDMCLHDNSSFDQCSLSTDEGSLTHTSLIQQQIATTSVGILIFGMLLQGLGKGPRFSYAITYVDNNTEKVNTGFHIGFTITGSVLAPVISYLLGGVFADMYVTLGDTNLTPRHPKWIGAWWMGYLVFGTTAILISLPLSCFPRGIARKSHPEGDNSAVADKRRFVEDTDTSANGKTSSSGDDNALIKSKKTHIYSSGSSRFKSLLGTAADFIKDFLKTMLRLFLNPVYMLVNLGAVFIIFSVSGQAFKAKYLEIIFDMPAHEANYVMAVVSFCSKCVGTFLGGYLTRRWKMTAYSSMRFTTICLAISMVANMAGFVLYCEQPEVINRPGTPLDCNTPCQCKDDSFFPVCGGDGRSYYSPCHAGCLEVESGVYTNCTCIPGGSATQGLCQYGCTTLYPYLVFAVIAALFQTITIMPKVVTFIRCVDDKDKTISIGFHSFTTNLLGWLLGEVVLGVVIDGVCDIWDVTCGVTGRCLLYNNDYFRLNIHGYSTVALALAMTCYFSAWMYARFKGILDGEPGQEIVVDEGENEEIDENSSGVRLTRFQDHEERSRALVV